MKLLFIGYRVLVLQDKKKSSRCLLHDSGDIVNTTELHPQTRLKWEVTSARRQDQRSPAYISPSARII